MNILCDFIGHADLYYSMHALFSTRLGCNLFRPLASSVPDSSGNIIHDGEWASHGVITLHLADVTWPYRPANDEFRPYIQTHEYEQRCITFDKFLSMEFDAIISTSYQHEIAMYELARKFKPEAKYIRQIANVREYPLIAKNVMLAMTTPMKPSTNYIKYHPETAPRYSFEPLPADNSKIKSFYNYMPSYAPDRQLWLRFKSSMPDFTFLHHGGQSDDGSIPHIDLHKVMKDSKFIWHTKPGSGDGFTLRQALACGRPIICDSTYSKRNHSLASEHMIDGFNCIDLNPSIRSFGQNVNMIREWSKPGIYEQKCQDVLKTFDTYIDYGKEAEGIKNWIGSL